MPPRIALICVGSELLRGKINTHASTIARRFAPMGLGITSEQTVGDDLAALTRAIRGAFSTHDLVIVTGGLGPTFDDLTREAASEATGRPLVSSSKLLQEIQFKFRRAKLKSMPPANKRQAFLLSGAQAISNAFGTAPGQWLTLGKKAIVLLPGPPTEMEPMLKGFVVPKLKHLVKEACAQAHLHFFGVPESEIDHKVRPIVAREQGVDFTILARPSLVDLDIFVYAGSLQAARTRLARIVRVVKQKTGRYLYGMNEENSLEQVVLNRLKERKATVSLAESCTGGLVSKRLTDLPGSSNYFLGGIVSYANSAKQTLLGVLPEALRKHGAVSKEVALAMAHGAREKFDSTYALSITGIAGPSGGTPKKPVGLVYIALASHNSARCKVFHFRGPREIIRQRAALFAINMLREFLL